MADFVVVVSVHPLLQYLWVVFSGFFGCLVRRFIARHAYIDRDPAELDLPPFAAELVETPIAVIAVIFAQPGHSLRMHALVHVVKRVDQGGPLLVSSLVWPQHAQGG